MARTRIILDDLISQADAARIRGVSRQSIADLIARGKLQPHVVAGHVLVSKADVENFKEGPRGRPLGSPNKKKPKNK